MGLEPLDGAVEIPMIGRGVSLNVAVAGSLVLHGLAGPTWVTGRPEPRLAFHLLHAMLRGLGCDSVKPNPRDAPHCSTADMDLHYSGPSTQPLPPDPRRAARNERRSVAALLGVLLGIMVVALVVLGVMLAAVSGGEPGMGLALGVGFALVFLAIILPIGGVMWALMLWRRRRGSRNFALSPANALPFRQRDRFLRAIARNEALAPQWQPFALAVARDMAGRRLPPVIFAVTGCVMIVSGVMTPVVGGFYALPAMAYFTLAGYFTWLRIQMKEAVVRLEAGLPTHPVQPQRPQPWTPVAVR